jgi:hypothetical protein
MATRNLHHDPCSWSSAIDYNYAQGRLLLFEVSSTIVGKGHRKPACLSLYCGFASASEKFHACVEHQLDLVLRIDKVLPSGLLYNFIPDGARPNPYSDLHMDLRDLRPIISKSIDPISLRKRMRVSRLLSS